MNCSLFDLILRRLVDPKLKLDSDELDRSESQLIDLLNLTLGEDLRFFGYKFTEPGKVTFVNKDKTYKLEVTTSSGKTKLKQSFKDSVLNYTLKNHTLNLEFEYNDK